MQIFFHKLNHGLLRQLDEDKKKDFFNNSKTKRQNNILKLKSRQKGTFFSLPADESGNYFDRLFYCGYYLDIIDMNLAEFYLKMKEFETKEEYKKNLIQIIEKISPNLNANIFKFKKNYAIRIPQCAFSLMRMSKIKNFQYNKEEIVSESSSENEEEMAHMEELNDEI